MRVERVPEMTTVRTVVVTVLAIIVFGSLAAAQSPAGALAIDERQGDQYGWAVDYETAAAAQGRALQECGPGCSVVLTFGRCAACAADQDADSRAVGWAESFDSAAAARQAALSECGSRGGSGCTVRVWGCNGSVGEEGLGLNRAARRQIQRGLRAEGFDPGGADGQFGPRTRAAIRNWQSARGARWTGYLEGPAATALQSAAATRLQVAEAATATSPQQPSGTAAQENLFWQSIMNSTNPADFEAYLEQFPNGVFRRLAENRLTALREQPAATPSGDAPRVGSPTNPGADARLPTRRLAIDFGDDTGDFVQDGECDDPRFEGDGTRSEGLPSERGRDATDCRRLYEAGRIRLFGVDLDSSHVDTSSFARNGECDDPRFEGDGMTALLLPWTVATTLPIVAGFTARVVCGCSVSTSGASDNAA